MDNVKQPAKSPAWTEADRLAAVDSYEILPLTAETSYDVIAQQAASICEAPVSLITILTEDHQWFKAAVGTTLTGTARAISFCTHAIEQTGTLVINDATQDARFRENPLVTGDTHIRFYAGVPLLSPHGKPVGTLCVLDQKPRTSFCPDQQAQLERLAVCVIDLLEERKAMLEAERLSALKIA